MLDKAPLSDDAIMSCLVANYAMPVTGIEFLPLGCDSRSWSYRVQAADGTAFFLKIRKCPLNEPSITVPRYLRNCGVAQIIAPLPTATQALWASLGDYALILYPFIEGRNGIDETMADSHWISYGAALRQIHATALPPELARGMRRETFVPQWEGVVRRLDSQIDAHDHADPTARELVAFWLSRRPEICRVADRARALGLRLRATNPPFVLCHADIHRFNLLLDKAGNLWIVDWDETVLAPVERDLMFVVGGIGASRPGPREEALFFRGYGEAKLDPLALAYYRFAWAVGDIGGFGEAVLDLPEMGDQSRRQAVLFFMGLFQPGEIVALALASDCATW